MCQVWGLSQAVRSPDLGKSVHSWLAGIVGICPASLGSLCNDPGQSGQKPQSHKDSVVGWRTEAGRDVPWAACLVSDRELWQVSQPAGRAGWSRPRHFPLLPWPSSALPWRSGTKSAGLHVLSCCVRVPPPPRTCPGLTHERSRCCTRQPWWCSSPAGVRSSPWSGTCRRPSPRWCWSAPWATRRWSPRGPAPARRRSAGCTGRPPVMSGKGGEGGVRPTPDRLCWAPQGPPTCSALVHRQLWGLQAPGRSGFRSEGISFPLRVC